MSKGWVGICRLGGIGDDLIVASPLAILKRLGYMVEMITAAPNHVVFLHNPHIDKLSVKVPDRDLPQGDMTNWQKWFDSRAQEYDLFAHFSHSCEVRHALFAGSTPFYWPAEYRRKLCAGSYLETAHDILGVPHEFGPLYFVSEDEKQRARETKKKIGPRCVGVLLNGTRIDKVYPYMNLAIVRLLKEVGPVVIFGGGSEKEFSMGQAIEQHVQMVYGKLEGLHSAMSERGSEEGGEKNWPLRRSLALLMECDLIITPDTGPAWAVAMAPMPKIMLHSHASVENITKHWVNTVSLHADQKRVPCWPCHKLHDTPLTCVQDKNVNAAACISDIGVEKLMITAKRLWNK